MLNHHPDILSMKSRYLYLFFCYLVLAGHPPTSPNQVGKGRQSNRMACAIPNYKLDENGVYTENSNGGEQSGFQSPSRICTG